MQAASLQQKNLAVGLLDAEIAKRKSGGKDTIKQEAERQALEKESAGLREGVRKGLMAEEEEGTGTESLPDTEAKGRFKSRKESVESVVKALPASVSAVEELTRETRALDAKAESYRAGVEEAKRSAVEEVAAAKARVEAIQREQVANMDLVSKRAYLGSNLEVASRGLAEATGGRNRNSPFVDTAELDKNVTGWDRAKAAAMDALSAFDRENGKVLEMERNVEGANRALDQARELGEARVRSAQKAADAAQEELEVARKNLDIARETARMVDAAKEGSRIGRMTGLDAGVGRYEGDRGMAEARSILGRMQEGLRGSYTGFEAGESKPVADRLSQTQSLSRLLEEQRRVQEILNSLDERRVKLVADAANKRAEETRELARQAFEEGKAMAVIQTSAYQPGQNETERLVRSIQAIGNGKVGAIADSKSRFTALGGDGLKSDKAAKEEGMTLGLIDQQMRNIVTYEERRLRVAKELVEARRAENKEASQALLMADREDQLRAALLAKYTQSKGGFSADQFSFLDQGTKEAVKKFEPSAMPVEADTKIQALTRESELFALNLSKLNDEMKAQLLDARKTATVNPLGSTQADQERDRLNDQLAGLRTTMNGVIEQLQRVAFLAPQTGTGSGAGGTGGNGTTVNIAAPQVAVSINVSQQFKDAISLVNAVVVARFDSELAVMRKTVSEFIAGQRAGAVQGAAAGY